MMKFLVFAMACFVAVIYAAEEVEPVPAELMAEEHRLGYYGYGYGRPYYYSGYYGRPHYYPRSYGHYRGRRSTDETYPEVSTEIGADQNTDEHHQRRYYGNYYRPYGYYTGSYGYRPNYGGYYGRFY